MFAHAPHHAAQTFLTRRFRTFGDSRACLVTGKGPDVHDGQLRTVRGSTSNQPTAHVSLPMFLRNAVIVCDGGWSGSTTSTWNTARGDGKTLAACMAIPADATIIDSGTNAVQQSVTDVASVTTVANTEIAAHQALITKILELKAPHEYVYWVTIMQRDPALGWLNANAVNKRNCVDQINTAMLAWIAALGNPKVIAWDIRALTNIGGVTTGADAITPGILGDGIHPGHKGALTIAQAESGLVAPAHADAGVQPLWRSVGPNLFQSISAGPVINTSTLNGAVNLFSIGVDGQGRPTVTVEFTPTADNTGRTVVEIRANVGSNGAGGPAANLVAAGDKLAFRALVSLDDGAGGTAPASSVSAYAFFAYVGGPALQQVQNGNIADTTGRGVPAGALVEMPLMTMPLAITNGSADIAAGANAGGAGFRVQVYLYGLTNGQKVRMVLTSPELRKIV
jgi:hypothetical protein